MITWLRIKKNSAQQVPRVKWPMELMLIIHETLIRGNNACKHIRSSIRLFTKFQTFTKPGSTNTYSNWTKYKNAPKINPHEKERKNVGQPSHSWPIIVRICSKLLRSCRQNQKTINHLCSRNEKMDELSFDICTTC